MKAQCMSLDEAVEILKGFYVSIARQLTDLKISDSRMEY